MNRKNKSKFVRAFEGVIVPKGWTICAAAPAEPKTLSINAKFEIEAAKAPADGEKPGPRKFSMVGYNGGSMNLAGFYSPVVIDLTGLSGHEKTRPIFRDHDSTQLVGHATAIKVADNSLTAEGVISGAGAAASEVLAAHDNGFPWQVSVGCRVNSMEFVKAGATATANGQEFNGPINIARKTVLGEISFVPLGADDSTSARIAAHRADGDTMDFGQWLKAKGFTLADLDDAQKTSLQAMYSAEQEAAKGNGKQPVAAKGLDDVLGAQRDKEKRQKEIVDITAKALQDNPGQLPIIEALSKQAMQGDWDTSRYELELLRATRPQANVRLRNSADEGISNDVIQAALCVGGGMSRPDAEKEFSEQTMDAASKRFKHGLGLQELLLLFGRRNGHDALSARNLQPLLKAAFTEERMITASGISTLSLPGILAATANKFLKLGFDSVESTWREIASIVSVRDFKQITSYSLTGDFEYEVVAPGGELKHATAGETSYTNQAKTYGRMFGIDRRDIINDDLGALTQAPKRLGRGGALKFNAVFWAEFMDNSAFFATGNANYLTGVTVGTNDTRANVEGLTRGETAFLNQTDPDGKPMAITPKIWLVPNALTVAATSLMKDTSVINNTVNTVNTTGNPHAGKFTVVRSSYLSNSAFTGYSVAASYLLADPNDIPVIEVAFLNGVQSPVVEQADADFNQLGIQMRGYHDFGANLQEPRGGIKLKGEA